MNDGFAGPEGRPDGGVRAALVTVSALLVVEAVGMIAIVVWLLFDLVTQQPSSYPTAIALLVLVLIGALWVSAVAIGSLRRAPWTRGAAIVWQVLQISVAVGAFQGLFARPDVGWLLLVPAVTVAGLLLWPPVGRAYARGTGEGEASDREAA